MVSEGEWHVLWTLNLDIPHTGAEDTVTFLVPTIMPLSPSLQVPRLVTQIMMTQSCSSACNTPYDPQCVASYLPPPWW
jgi:hypothetical protein